MAKLVEATTARDSIKETLTRAKMLGLHADVVSQAVSAPYPDFEDEMLIAFCLSQKADLLITNDKQLLKRSVEGLRILTSGKALEAIA